MFFFSTIFMIKEMIPLTIFPILTSNKRDMRNMPMGVRQSTRPKTISQKSSNVKFPVFFISASKAAEKQNQPHRQRSLKKGTHPSF
jgi:hypothetical protein